MTPVILPESVRQREICSMLATNVKKQQNHIKRCIRISLILKETVAERRHTGFLVTHYFIFGIKNHSLYKNYSKPYSIR